MMSSPLEKCLKNNGFFSILVFITAFLPCCLTAQNDSVEKVTDARLSRFRIGISMGYMYSASREVKNQSPYVDIPAASGSGYQIGAPLEIRLNNTFELLLPLSYSRSTLNEGNSTTSEDTYGYTSDQISHAYSTFHIPVFLTCHQGRKKLQVVPGIGLSYSNSKDIRTDVETGSSVFTTPPNSTAIQRFTLAPIRVSSVAIGTMLGLEYKVSSRVAVFLNTHLFISIPGLFPDSPVVVQDLPRLNLANQFSSNLGIYVSL
jgi:hypothetical protein